MEYITTKQAWRILYDKLHDMYVNYDISLEQLDELLVPLLHIKEKLE